MARKPQDVCRVQCINPAKTARVRRAMAPDGDLEALAAIFKVLGDLTRVRILAALSLEELCVCDLTTLLGVTQSAVSHQLRLLRAERLVKHRRDGKVVYYSLHDEHVKTLLGQVFEHVQQG